MRASPWKIVYVLLCLALLVFTAYQFLMFLPESSTGWDYRVYVSAVQAFDHSQDPYILENVAPYQLFNANLVFDYPPHTLYFFWLLDFFLVFHYLIIYYVLLIVLLITSAYLIVNLDKKPHYLFLTTLLLTGFISMSWNFLTGNSPILFLFLFAVIFTLWVKGKYWQSSIVMGLSAAISLFTSPFIVLYLLVKRPIIDRLALMSLSVGIVASLFVVDYLINPAYLISYIGRMHGHGSPFNYPGGWNQPAPYLMFKDALSGISAGSIIPVVLVSCGYVAFVLYATWRYYRKNNGNTLKILSLVMLAVFMVLPYMAPYDFIILVIPLYFLFKDCSYRIKTLVLAVISLLPSFIWYSPSLGINDDNLPFLLGSYAQTYSLILIFLVVILCDHLTPASNEERKNGKKPEGRRRSYRAPPEQQEPLQ